jgi:hypothetical protein
MLAVKAAAWDFDRDRLVTDMVMRWPDTTFSPEMLPEVGTLGQVVVRDGDATVLVELLTIPGGLGAEGDDDLLADVLAAIATTQGVPGDGSLVVVGWSTQPVPLTPTTSAATLRAMQS